MADKNYCPDCNAFLAYGGTHKPLCLLGNAVIVPRQDYETLKDTVLQLQTKYQTLLDDKQRWRNFAILSAAANLVAERAYTTTHAIDTASELLSRIERANNVEPG